MHRKDEWACYALQTAALRREHKLVVFVVESYMEGVADVPE
jgi:hypothetical protein